MMFDKRLTKLCPESKKYIAGNIILQWLELALNTVMVITAAKTVSSLYYKEWSMNDLTVPVFVIIGTLIIRFFTHFSHRSRCFFCSASAEAGQLRRYFCYAYR